MSRSELAAVDKQHWAILAISEARLLPYLKVTKFDVPGAMKLYCLNIQASMVLFSWIAVAEVALRNSLIQALNTYAGVDPQDPFEPIWHILENDAKASFMRTKTRVVASHKFATGDTLVSELPFNFWRHLLAARYEASLWTPFLRHGFSGLKVKRRSIVFDAVSQVGELRNRIAHHEPIFHRVLGCDLERIQDLIGWISPEALAWARANLPDLATARI